MSCITDMSPCHAELLFSVNLLSSYGLKPADFKGELLFMLICGSMQNMLFVKSLIYALQSEEQHICNSLEMYGHFSPSFAGIPFSNGESKAVYNQSRETFFHVLSLCRGGSLGMKELYLVL